MFASPAILVFDSGLGGLTVFREIVLARPDARFVYVADDAGFPYGNQPEAALVARIIDVIGAAIAEHAPDLVVVACNTASTLALTELRARFAVPFVGTVPAIKPACARSLSKRIAVLGTQATVNREYTRALIREFAAGCDVVLVGSPPMPRPSWRAWPSTMPPSRPRSPAASSIRRTAAPTPWCSLARTIRCCSSASGRSRPGRSNGSIRRRRSRAASPT
jgi:hypothetical protein